VSAKKHVMDFEGPPWELLRARTRDGVIKGPADIHPDSKPGYLGGRAEGEATLAIRAERLSQLQELLYANGVSGNGKGASVLLVVQAMDTAGKGGIMRNVAGAMDPQGVETAAFKAPTEEERSHHFLWRVRKHLPDPGFVAVFDRSHYEDVLIHRVRQLTSLHTIERRYEEIRRFERDLAERNTRIVKVMLHITKEEQQDRLAERLDRPDKFWKYAPGDVDERAHWDEYMDAYRVAIEETDADHAPWFIVPANRKWYSRIAVQELLITALESLELQWPPADFDVALEKRRLAES
jgi:PPK2 family polyphosphate:nucleotide phosphotransferase